MPTRLNQSRQNEWVTTESGQQQQQQHKEQYNIVVTFSPLFSLFSCVVTMMSWSIIYKISRAKSQFHLKISENLKSLWVAKLSDKTINANFCMFPIFSLFAYVIHAQVHNQYLFQKSKFIRILAY